jgi:hypothetical protein
LPNEETPVPNDPPLPPTHHISAERNEEQSKIHHVEENEKTLQHAMQSQKTFRGSTAHHNGQSGALMQCWVLGHTSRITCNWLHALNGTNLNQFMHPTSTSAVHALPGTN